MPSKRRRQPAARARSRVRARARKRNPLPEVRLPEVRLPEVRLPKLGELSMKAKIALVVGVLGLGTAVAFFLKSRATVPRLTAPPPPPTRGRLSSSELPTESWAGLLGVYKASGPNFNLMEDGRNNYRGGIKDKYTKPTEEFFRDLKKNYGIQRVISLSGSKPAKYAPEIARAAGLEGYYFPMGETSLGKKGTYAQIREILRKGNTLLHCTHGADRTGAMAGRYYVDEGIMSVDQALADMEKFKSGDPYEAVVDFIKYGPQD